MMPRPRLISDQQGFTIIEVMVAAAILVTGLLGTVALIDRANASTVRTQAREAATVLAREIVEDARSVRYDELTPAGAVATLQERPGLEDTSTAAGWTIQRRGFTYTATVNVCPVDDARDGRGTTTTGFCPGAAPPSTSGPTDDDPEDYKQVTVTLTWQREGGTRTVRQTGVVANARNDTGPSIVTLNPSTLSPSTGQPVSFEVTTNRNAVAVDWAVDGAHRDTLEAPSGSRQWGFTWTVDLPAGVHVVSAQAFDAFGRSAGLKAVNLDVQGGTAPPPPPPGGGGEPENQPPSTPGGLSATVQANQKAVDLSWNASTDPEGDAVSYNVYRDNVLLTSVTQLTFTDSSWGEVPRAYTVRAVDAKGALSPPSNVANAYPRGYTP